MKIIVSKHDLKIEKQTINEKEINITKCEFIFDEDITNDFVKDVYFTLNDETYKISNMQNNECDIPNEVLDKKGMVELGVVAYLIENGEYTKRYNPTSTFFPSERGSLKEEYENTEPITPSDKEQMEQAIQEMEVKVDNIDIDAEKVDTTTTITITKKDGSTKEVEILDGEQGPQGEQGIQGPQGEQGVQGPTGQTGATGNGIASINKTSTSGLVDTYTITYTNGTTTTFNVTNGETQDISGKEDKTNKVTKIDENSTDTQYPSAKCVYNEFEEIKLLATELEDKTEEIENGTQITDSANYLGKVNEIIGDTQQDGTPTPDTPVEIQSVTGLQNIEVCGKNLITTYNYASSGYINYNYDNSKIGKTMTYSFIPNFSTTNATLYIRANTSISSYNVGTIATITSGTKVSVTFTLTDEQYNTIKNTTGGYIQVYKSGVSMDENSISNSMLEINNQATEYEPYTGTTYEVNLGKNLLDAEQESYTFNANTNNSRLPIIGTINLIANTTYYISYNIDTQMTSNTRSTPYLELGSSRYYQSESNNQNLTTGRKVWEFTPTTSGTYNFGYWSHTPDVDLIVSKFMISKSSDTTYSSYFTPIELNKIGDYQDKIKKSTGKNLFKPFNFTKTSSNITFTYNEDGSINCNGTSNGNALSMYTSESTPYLITLSAGTYTISGNTDDIRLEVLDSSGNSLCTTSTTNNFTINSITKVFVRANILSGKTINNIKIYPQLEKGTQSTSYEPYGKVWYIEKQIGKVVLDGSETWNLTATYTNNVRFNSTINLGTTTPLISNYFLEGRGGTDTTNIDTNGNSGVLMITIPKSIASTISELTTWLSTHNTEVLYVLNTPTTTEITNTELIEDLEALNKILTYQGINNFTISSDNLTPTLNLTYKRSNLLRLKALEDSLNQ